MKCEKCHQKEGSVVFRHLVDGQSFEHIYCEGCAIHVVDLSHIKLYPSTEGDDKGMTDNPLPVTNVYQTKCPRCQMSYAMYKQLGKLGCSHCYHAFGQKLKKDVLQVQPMIAFKEKRPPAQKPGEAFDDEYFLLKQALEKAVSEERYEAAALLRDQLKKMEEA